MDLALPLALAFTAYLAWAVRRDWRRGIAESRGFSYDRETQPDKFAWLMAFHIAIVALGAIGCVGLVVRGLFFH